MKEFLIFLPLTIIYLAFKSALFPNVPLPDLPLIIVFHMAYRRASLEGAILAFVLGFIDDAFSGSVIGSASFSLIFVFVAVYFVSFKVHFSTPATRAAGAASAALVKGVITYLILRSINPGASLFGHVALQTVVTGIFAPAVITLMARLSALLSPKTFKDNAN